MRKNKKRPRKEYKPKPWKLKDIISAEAYEKLKKLQNNLIVNQNTNEKIPNCDGRSAVEL